MTLAELRQQLNGLRTDPGWKQGWLDRGADFEAVLRTIRFKLLPRAEEHWNAQDQIAWNETVAIITDYVAYKHWEALTVPLLRGGDPECDSVEEATKRWVAYVTTCNPMQTYAQAIYMFHERHGFWPKRNWPGMPMLEFDRGRRIKDVPRDRLQPGLPGTDDGVTDGLLL